MEKFPEKKIMFDWLYLFDVIVYGLLCRGSLRKYSKYSFYLHKSSLLLASSHSIRCTWMIKFNGNREPRQHIKMANKQQQKYVDTISVVEIFCACEPASVQKNLQTISISAQMLCVAHPSAQIDFW